MINSFEDRLAIFGGPFAFPTPDTFTLDGYQTLGSSAHFELYFLNSFFRHRKLAVIDPDCQLDGCVRARRVQVQVQPDDLSLPLDRDHGADPLGTVGILQLIVFLHLVNTLWCLILIYTAQGIPLAIFVLTTFMRQVPRDLKDAARIDGASEYRIYLLIAAFGTTGSRVRLSDFHAADLERSLVPTHLGARRSDQDPSPRSSNFLGRIPERLWRGVSSADFRYRPSGFALPFFARQLIRGITAGAVK